MQEGYAVSDFNFIKKGPADHQRSAGISDRKMSRIVTARKVGMMTAQGVNNRNDNNGKSIPVYKMYKRTDKYGLEINKQFDYKREIKKLQSW